MKEFENLKQDLEFVKRTEAAWERYEKGKFKSSTAKEFLKDLEDNKPFFN